MPAAGLRAPRPGIRAPRAAEDPHPQHKPDGELWISQHHLSRIGQTALLRGNVPPVLRPGFYQADEPA